MKRSDRKSPLPRTPPTSSVVPRTARLRDPQGVTRATPEAIEARGSQSSGIANALSGSFGFVLGVRILPDSGLRHTAATTCQRLSGETALPILRYTPDPMSFATAGSRCRALAHGIRMT